MQATAPGRTGRRELYKQVVGAFALLLSTLPAAAAAQVERPSAAPVPISAGSSPWTFTGQVEAGFTENGGHLRGHSGEMGLRLSRAVSPGWRLGLALSRKESAYENLRQTYFDLGLERVWDVSDRVSLVAFGGVSAGSITADEEVLDEGTVYGAHAGFATEIRLVGKLVLRPEVRQRFVNADHDGLDEPGVVSLGFGLRF